MTRDSSVRFFDEQFQRQVAAGDLQLNPFEVAALPHVRGKVLDFGCGLGNLSVAAARRGCALVAVDASRTAIEHLRSIAKRDGLQIQAEEADLRTYEVSEDFDTVVCIGLLMFFNCSQAFHQLSALQARVRPGGTMVVNVLTEGTTYMEMFAPEEHCLFKRGYLRECFGGWELVSYTLQEFPAPGDTVKAFETAIAQKPR